MHALTLALILTLVPVLAGAGDAPMSAADFDAYSRGKTLTYSVDGRVYGAEQYLPGRRVIWAFEGQACQRGTWTESAGQICFHYEGDPEPACWQFFPGPEGLTARFASDPEGTALKEIAQSPAPLSCPGPEVGV